ncbi:MAG: MBL fold metallo-hydrolase [Oscillospiraceae bacterium]|jgi:glyoxylase-like metal-dependent hydrolase (beta-lactamase superfamily II)|nr:MBL fold metallo-hydrolase [Oscillospiraceae bacterium]
MLVKAMEVGQLSTNCYVVTDESTLECAVIDPGAESGRILNYIEENKLKPVCIMLTHGHFDHTTGVDVIQSEKDIPVYINKKDVLETGHASLKFSFRPFVRYYGEGDEIKVGSLVFRVMETPGHSEGSVTLICEDAIFSGDTLFRSSVGRTDFAGGDPDVLLDSLRRIAALEGSYDVFPGHADATTLDRERRFNPYVRVALEG